MDRAGGGHFRRDGCSVRAVPRSERCFGPDGAGISLMLPDGFVNVLNHGIAADE